jgi:16S rRNA G966 N2-methylase RsmD
MSRKFRHAVYVERNAQLVEVAKHNFDMLDLQNVEAVNGDGVEFLHQLVLERQLHTSNNNEAAAEGKRKTVIFLDPARRDAHGKKVFRLEDCTPDVLGIRDELLQCADVVMIKLSPMLDWHEAVKQLTANLPSERNNVHCEVHVISVKNECKELLIILRPQTSDDVHQPVDADNHQIKLICINDNQRFETEISKDTQQEPLLLDRVLGDEAGHYLFVPNASIMKAGVFAQLSHTYGIPMLDQDTHYYIGDHDVENFPGRRFHILAVSTMNKKELKRKLAGITQANIAVRNFPLSAVELRKRLKLKDGGDKYLFVTTVQGNHVVFICQNVKLSL